MTRRPLLLPPLLAVLGACGLEHIDAILAKYDTFGETGTTAGTDTSTGEDSTGTASTAPDPGTTELAAASTTGGAEAGHDASTAPESTTTGTTTDHTTTADTTTTGTAPPVCGDGVLDPGEECDDANADPNDGCKECALDRLVFCSSVMYHGGELDGLYGADQRCRMLAAKAKLPNFATYRAWLSDSTLSAADRLLHHRGRYTLVNGLVVAMDWHDLTDGTLQNPLNVTELSQTAPFSRAWTGTLASGKQAFGSSFCEDWTKWGDGQLGGSGIHDQTDALWSFLEQDDCAFAASIYCFEQP